MIGLSLDDLYYFRNNIVWVNSPQTTVMVPSLDKLFANPLTHLHQRHGTFPHLMRWCSMNQTATELREAAASARAFADNIGSAELKRSFREMARRWEAQADECEPKELRSRTSRAAGRKPTTRKH